MFKDSSSPQTDLRNLQQWLSNPLTQEVLSHLVAAADSLNNLILEVVPDSILGTHLREQSIGEVRGLRFLGKVLLTEQDTLQLLVDEINNRAKDEAVHATDESSTPSSEFLHNS
jgi:hypothetical protein